MIREVFQSWLDSPIVFAGDEYEPVGVPDLARQLLEHLGGLAPRIFLVHPVEHRQVNRLGIDQLHLLPSPTQPLDYKPRKPDAHPVGTIGPIKYEDTIAHISVLAAKRLYLPVNIAGTLTYWSIRDFAVQAPIAFRATTLR